jgi:5-methylcytosine-specific restriction endonuclease McrA
MKQIEVKLDDLVRKIVRKRDCPNGVWFHCFVCRQRTFLLAAQVMHFVTRSNRGLRWDLINCNLGCRTCNCFDNVHHKRYEARMIEVHGEATLNALRIKGRNRFEMMPFELLELYDRLKSELN